MTDDDATGADLRALRDELEAEAQQPGFGYISSRRHNRTRRLSMLGVAAVTIAVLVGSTVQLKFGLAPQPPIAPTSSPSAITSITSAEETFFALDADRQRVMYSDDRGENWKPLMTGINEQGTLAGANHRATWMVTSRSVWYITENSSSAGLANGRTGAFSVAKERLWLASDGQVWIWNARSEPVPTAPLPAPVTKVAALSAEAAVVMTMSEDDVATWYYTYDAGASWTKRPDPCGTSDHHVTITPAPDRSLWLVCTVPSTEQQQERPLVSTDDGDSWQPHGPLGNTDDRMEIYPLSWNVAWRTGTNAGIYRTVGGAQWETIAANKNGVGFKLAVTNPRTAIGLTPGEGALLTQDAGHTWSPVTF